MILQELSLRRLKRAIRAATAAGGIAIGEQVHCIGGVAGGAFAARGLSASGEWVATSIADLVASFDTRFSEITTSGGAVTGWPAHLGFAYNMASSGSGQRPAYEATGWTAPTSGRVYPSILFDGTDDDLLCADVVSGSTIPERMIGGTDLPGTVIMVAEVLSTTGSVSMCSFTKVGLGAADRRVAMAVNLTSALYRTHKEDDSNASKTVDSVASTPAPDTAKHCHSWAVDTNLRMRRDGSQIASGDLDLGVTTLDRFEIGSTYGGTNANMRIVRCDLYARSLSDDELIAAYSGLAGIYL